MKCLTLFVIGFAAFTITSSQRTIPGLTGNNNGLFNILFPWFGNSNPPVGPLVSILRPVQLLQPDRPGIIFPITQPPVNPIAHSEVSVPVTPTSESTQAQIPEISSTAAPAGLPFNPIVKPGQSNLPGSEFIAGRPDDDNKLEENQQQLLVDENSQDLENESDPGQIQNRALIAKKLLLKGAILGKLG